MIRSVANSSRRASGIVVAGLLCWQLAYAHLNPPYTETPVYHYHSGLTNIVSPRYTHIHYPDVELPIPPRLHIKRMSLEEAILLALRLNPAVRNNRLDRVVQKFALEVAHNEFELKYKLLGGAEFINGEKPRYTVDPAVSLRTTYGTQFNARMHNTFGQGGTNSTATFELSHPLLRGAGHNVVMTPFYNAVDQDKINQLNLKNVLMQTVTAAIQRYYRIVQSYNELSVQELALQQSIKNLRQIRLKIQVGKAAEAEATEQKSQIASQRLAVEQLENEIKRQYKSLLIVLGLDPCSHISIERHLNLGNIIVPNLPSSLHTALRHNVKYRAELINFNSFARNLFVARNSQLPKLDIHASASEVIRATSDAGVTATDGSLIRDVNGVLVRTTTEKRVGFTFDIPIDDVQRQSELVDAKVNYEKEQINLENERRQLKTNVINAVRDLGSQAEQIKLAENAANFAKKDYQNTIKAWKYGKVSLFEVTTKRNNLTNARTSLINEKITYIVTLANFHLDLGVTLDIWHVNIIENGEQHAI